MRSFPNCLSRAQMFRRNQFTMGGDQQVPYANNPAIEYTSGKALMKHGPDAMHDHLSSRMEAAIGRALPQMEVRFKNLSITADVVVSDNKNEEILPTLSNAMIQMVRSMLPTSKHTETRHILKNINGVFKPGTMTLLLGQPGSGKSSLMKILGGRFALTRSTKVEGEILYNGANQHEVSKRVPQFVSYVTQRDFHVPTLTVKETLEFAHECCGGELSKHAADIFNKGSPEDNRAALEAAQAWIKHYPEIVTQQLGLEHCQDTVVGDAMLRGVSGGERKRVTTGEMQFGNKSVILMDEISTGLDSAATYDIVKTQLSLARKMRKTVVIALLQPSPEVFELFDYVMVLNKGHVMYHGPQDQALSYFESLGFRLPAGRDVADFLLDIGTHQQVQYQTGLSLDAKYPRKASEFAQRFEVSSIHTDMLNSLHAPHDPELIRDREDYFDNIPEFHQSFWASTMTLARREMKIKSRNIPFLMSRAVMIIVNGLINGSVFWQFDPKNVQVATGVLFQTVQFLAFSQFAQIPTFFTTREIFYKQRAANFYRTTSYVLAFTVSQIPLALVETLSFGSMIYFMSGFSISFEQYVLYLILLFAVALEFGAFFFTLTCIMPNLNACIPFSMLCSTGFVLYGGFVIAEAQMPDYLVWIYWANPMSWAMHALAVNEYSGAKYDVNNYDGINYMEEYGMKMGEYTLNLVGFDTGKKWIVFALVFIVAMYFFFSTLSFLALEYFRYETPENSSLPAEDDEESAYTHSDVSSRNSSSADLSYVLAQTPRGDSSGEVIVELQPPRDNDTAVPVTLAFKDLWYTVPNPQNRIEGLELLKGINGYARPGTITALMGSSGAGKTTLMDVIAGRKTGGTIRGQILLNGHPATPLAIQRSTGYCEQMDIHSEASTFREALTFSAFLRQGDDVPDAVKYDWVEECLDLLDLRPIADRIIRGSSVEQMKRLTIGVELAAKPSVLFLDEPTSGLDARSAKIIMDSVRKVANTGRTVVCTIHQPSTEVFQVFDSLLLLKRGGYTVYFGELGKNASTLVNYLQSVEGVAPLEDGYNPATWMLEAIGAGVDNSAAQQTDFAEVFEHSAQKAQLLAELERDGMSRPAAGVSALEFTSKRAASNWVQFRLVARRFLDVHWRTPSYNISRIGINTLISLLFGLSFNDIEYTTYQGINAGVGMIGLICIFTGFNAFNGAIPMVGFERASFYRERASQTYSALWYAVGGALVEIPYTVGIALVFSAIVFPLVNFSGADSFFFFWLQMAMYLFMMTLGGMLFAHTLPSAEVGTIFAILFNSILFLTMGFNPPASQIPSGYTWLHQITPMRFSFEALTTIALGNCPSNGSDPSRVACAVVKNSPPTVTQGATIMEFLNELYELQYDHAWRDFGVVLAICVGFVMLSLVALRFINHQKR